MQTDFEMLLAIIWWKQVDQDLLQHAIGSLSFVMTHMRNSFQQACSEHQCGVTALCCRVRAGSALLKVSPQQN